MLLCFVYLLNFIIRLTHDLPHKEQGCKYKCLHYVEANIQARNYRTTLLRSREKITEQRQGGLSMGKPIDNIHLYISRVNHA